MTTYEHDTTEITNPRPCPGDKMYYFINIVRIRDGKVMERANCTSVNPHASTKVLRFAKMLLSNKIDKRHYLITVDITPDYQPCFTLI